MNNQELLFNLIKKLESGELRFVVDENYTYYLTDKEPIVENCIRKTIGNKVRIGKLNSKDYDPEDGEIQEEEYNPVWNKTFKENFYKEKGLDKCWYKDCSNKIYQTANDYKTVNIQCQDEHKRYICLKCYQTKVPTEKYE